MRITLARFKKGIQRAILKADVHGLNKEENKLPFGRSTYVGRSTKKARLPDSEPSEKDLAAIENRDI